MNREGPERDVRYEDVPEDDRIIGQALRWSLVVVVGVAVLVTGIWLLLGRKAPAPVVQEAVAIPAQSLSKAVSAKPPEVRFTDITRAAGIRHVHVSGAYGERLLPETMGGNATVLDVNNDGHPDLLFINSGHWPWHRPGGKPPRSALYINQGDGNFADRTAGSGLEDLDIYGMGAAVADIDGDDLPDLFITAVGTNRLLRNLGGGRFEDITDTAGVAGAADAWSTSAAFFDYDGDGDLDLFVCNYVRWSREIDYSVDYRLTGIGRAYGPPTNYAGTHSYLYENQGNGHFRDVSAAAGIQVSNPATGLPAGKALAVLPVDFDADGRMDLLVTNDTVQNFAFHNLGDGHFEEAGMQLGVAFDNTGKATGAMGVDVATYNNNGDVAFAVGNFANEMTSFYVARKGLPVFTDEAIVSGIGPESRQALSFGLFFFDYDLDGRVDLLQTNGHVEDEINVVQPSQHYEQPTQLFWNCGSGCARTFEHVATKETGDLGLPVVGRGAAFADFDGDGDLDVVVGQVNRRPVLLRNDQKLGNHWLRVKVRGSAANRDAIGARVRIRANEQEQWRLVSPSRSYLSQVELPVTFGLGDHDQVESVQVQWPDGAERELRDVAADQLLVVDHPAAAGN
ncbi:MAG: CRTAC1 family protein [Gammaproteobacteria bacterium]|nr:CRTAC1 family protein [Gammaproteobacteria bacterium]